MARSGASPGKSRRSVGADARPERVKKTVVLDVEMDSRLGSFAGHYRMTESAVVRDALTAHMKGFFVSIRKDGQGDRAEDRPVRIAGSTTEPATRESA